MTNRTVTIALYVLRIAGIGAIALGLAFWSGQLLGLLRVHMALGLAVVLALWTLSVAAVVHGGMAGRAAVLIILGLAVLIVGMTQTSLLPGPQHWVVRAVHLLLGVGALRQGEVAARRLRPGAGPSTLVEAPRST
jgi:hypothetical protein